MYHPDYTANTKRKHIKLTSKLELTEMIENSLHDFSFKAFFSHFNSVLLYHKIFTLTYKNTAIILRINMHTVCHLISFLDIDYEIASFTLVTQDNKYPHICTAK